MFQILRVGSNDPNSTFMDCLGIYETFCEFNKFLKRHFFHRALVSETKCTQKYKNCLGENYGPQAHLSTF